MIMNERTQRPFKVNLENHGEVTIRPEDHRATGGEGSIFQVKDIVVKIYLDSKKIKKEDMIGKIRALSHLKHPFVIAPLGLATNSLGEVVGHYMQYVDGDSLPRLFTNTFWRERNFTFEKASILVERMRDVVIFGHKMGAILRDANELNWIVTWNNVKEPEPRIVDVDSWSIGKWQGRVVMLSVRDWQTKGFQKESDWFSWGTVTFQIYTGIHPYKGNLPGFKMGDLEGRMKANASVFSKGIRLVSAVRDFSNIPGPLLDWYIETFHNGKRTVPPSPFEAGHPVLILQKEVHEMGDESLVFEKLFTMAGDSVVKIFSCGVVLFGSKKLVDLKKGVVICKAKSRSCNLIKVDGGWILAEMFKDKPVFSFISKDQLKTSPLQLEVDASAIMTASDRLFLVTEKGLTEVKSHMFDRPILSCGQTWGVIPKETRWFDGIGIQDAMGSSYIIMPFGKEECAHIRVPELDNLRPVAAKAEHRFATVLAVNRSGLYQKLEFVFDKEHTSYKLWQKGTDFLDLNIAILSKGVCATIVSDGELVVFVPSQEKEAKASDRRISTDSLLFSWEDTVLLAKGGTVWKIRMK